VVRASVWVEDRHRFFGGKGIEPGMGVGQGAAAMGRPLGEELAIGVPRGGHWKDAGSCTVESRIFHFTFEAEDRYSYSGLI
jgi:hypothetical protein